VKDDPRKKWHANACTLIEDGKEIVYGGRGASSSLDSATRYGALHPEGVEEDGLPLDGDQQVTG
ncbi:unnamed protein product, partial [Amoebophrya sp. A25]